MRLALPFAIGVGALAGGLAFGIDLAVPRAHLPPILAGIAVAAAFVGGGYVIGQRAKLSLAAAAPAIAIGALVYVALTVVGGALLATRATGGAARTLPAVAIGAAIAALGMASGVSGAARRRDRSRD